MVGVCWQICQFWTHLRFHALLHRRSFHITYEKAESNDHNNDQVLGDSAGETEGHRGPKGGYGPEGPHGSLGSVAPLFVSLCIMCPIFLVKDDEGLESNISCSNNWVNSQGIVEDTKCVWFWFTWFTVICKDIFEDSSPNCDTQKKNRS